MNKREIELLKNTISLAFFFVKAHPDCDIDAVSDCIQNEVALLAQNDT